MANRIVSSSIDSSSASSINLGTLSELCIVVLVIMLHWVWLNEMLHQSLYVNTLLYRPYKMNHITAINATTWLTIGGRRVSDTSIYNLIAINIGKFNELCILVLVMMLHWVKIKWDVTSATNYFSWFTLTTATIYF